jgi:hypothetical protein
MDGITGLTAEIGNIDQFVDAIQKLHQDRDLFERLSAGALDHVRTNFSKEVVIPQYVAQIREVWREITSGEYQRPYAPKYGAYPGISVPPLMIEQLLPRS